MPPRNAAVTRLITTTTTESLTTTFLVGQLIFFASIFTSVIYLFELLTTFIFLIFKTALRAIFICSYYTNIIYAF